MNSWLRNTLLRSAQRCIIHKQSWRCIFIPPASRRPLLRQNGHRSTAHVRTSWMRFLMRMKRRNRCQSIGKRDCPNVPIGKGSRQGSMIWLVPNQSVQNTITLRQAPVGHNYPGGIAEDSTDEGWRQKKNESDSQYFARFACSWEDKTSRTLTQKSVMISEFRTQEGT